MNEFILDGFTVKSGQKDVWFIHDEHLSRITANLMNVRLKPDRLKRLTAKARWGDVVEITFSGNHGLCSFNGFIQSISINKRKADIVIESSGLLKYRKVE